MNFKKIYEFLKKKKKKKKINILFFYNSSFPYLTEYLKKKYIYI